MQLWSRVLKEVRPAREERIIPPRPLRLVAAGETCLSREDGDGNRAARAAVAAAREEAAAIIAAARQEAEAIKKAALEDRERVLAEGRAAGEEQGYREGLARAHQEGEAIRREAAAIREEARRVLQEARQAYQETITAAEGDIIDLALTIAARVIGQEVEEKPGVVMDMARQAIRQVAEGQHYIIYASPEAAAIIRQHRDELLAETAPGARLQVVADPGFQAGGCRIETENGFIDASVDTQLEEVKKILRGSGRP